MTSFLMGKVMEPEIRTYSKDGRVSTRFNFGVLSGKSLPLFDIWDNDENFNRAATSIKDGIQICVVLSSVVDKSGHLKHYVKDFAVCPNDLRDKFKALFQPTGK